MNLFGTLRFALACASAAAIVSVASAGPVGPELVTNGGFENTSSLAGSGWTVSGFTGEGFDYMIDTDPANAHSGNHSFAGGAVGGLGFISQTIATTAGKHYIIDLWLANVSGFADGTGIQVLWGGVPVYTATDILGFNYREIVLDLIATGTSISIGLRDDSFFLNVDDISVRAAAVPEPITLALLLLGGIGVAGLARRRASTA